MSAHEAVVCVDLGKRFRRYRSDAPRRFKDLLLGNWRALRPEAVLWALAGVNFTLARGRMLGVIGRNGAGKSTLLRLVGGVGTPDTGSLLVRGRVGALLDLGLGFHPELTGRENVFVNGVIAGLTRREVARRFDAIVEFAELNEFIDAPLRTYSTGMRMRLGFAIAAHTDPDLLLVDEVLSVGDLGFQNKCMERIAHFKREGAAILLVSHNLHEVRSLCDQVLWLERGQVRADGPAEEVAAAYESAMVDVELAAHVTPASGLAASGTPLTLHENRFGTLEVELTEVRAPRVVASGQAVQVDMGFLAHRPVASPIFQVKLIREDGVVCCDTNTLDAGIYVPTLEGQGRLRMRFERQDLAGGDYFVEVGVYHKDWERMFDYHTRVYPLRVEAPAGGERVLNVPTRWELLSEAHTAAASRVT